MSLPCSTGSISPTIVPTSSVFDNSSVLLIPTSTCFSATSSSEKKILTTEKKVTHEIISSQLGVCGECLKKNSVDLLLCQRCKKISYCNRVHQKAHWIYHKVVCKEVNTKEKIRMMCYNGIIDEENEEDIVVFVSKRSDEYVQKLEKKGYKGLTRLDELEHFLKLQKYREILKFLWSDKSQSHRISWLKQQAPKGHAILMLELYRELVTKDKVYKEDVQEGLKWWFLGLHCTELDSYCTHDRSTLAAVSQLEQWAYSLGLISSEFKEMISKEFDSIKFSAISKWVPDPMHPSPKWVLAHGLLSLFNSDKDSLISEDEWISNRTERHKILLELLINPNISDATTDSKSCRPHEMPLPDKMSLSTLFQLR